MTPLENLIREIPKAELHVHLEGTLEPELKFELAERNHLPLPYDSVEAMRAGYVFTGLVSFLNAYYEGASVLVTERDFHDLTYAYLERAHADNIVYAELMFDPQAHADRGVGFETVIEGIHAGQTAAQEALGIHSQLILCFLREKSVESAMQALERGLGYRDWIAGVGLDSDETDHPPQKFSEVFRRARSEDLEADRPLRPGRRGGGREHLAVRARNRSGQNRSRGERGSRCGAGRCDPRKRDLFDQLPDHPSRTELDRATSRGQHTNPLGCWGQHNHQHG